MLAALALPGLALGADAPDSASISIKYLDYRDSQPNLDRVHVASPALELMVPIAGEWSVRAGVLSDAVSGASPRYHTAVSGASHFRDRRNSVDAEVTRYLPRATVSLAAGQSDENDYRSRHAALQASVSSADNNTTWLAGIGAARDRINPVNKAVTDEEKHTVDLMLGVTQVLTPADIVQAVVTTVRGRGYFSNPYKYVDNRPRERDQHSALLRWNHHHAASGATTRLGMRHADSSDGVRSHMLQADYVWPLSRAWTLTPSTRAYTQSAADFYFDPVYDKRFGPPFPPGFVFGAQSFMSADQRLSAFGALTLALKIERQVGRATTVDLKFERYEQKAKWRQFGSGSPGLQDFSARTIQAGITHLW
ncbi:DUF3570 domain-containing protein [Massilia cavernae]|uniref:DUF3570 domain-containing protein n=2 Tax=Massilia cavernae TaxID=2320864 RepID=A0A418Y5H5_9BURK|nr:DUF3570 domain-containing protein [Massilia cavernae]